MRITAIDRQPRRRHLDVRIDGGLVLPVSPEVLARFQLRVGEELDQARLDEIADAESRHSALAAALRLLTYRPRSEAELRDRLARRRAPARVIEEVIARLKELSLIDDAAFARTWVDSRQRTSPRGRRLIAAELRSKGLARPVVESSLSGLDEAEAAYRAAARRARSLDSAPYPQFRRRLMDLLLRRGFEAETAGQAVRRLWQERSGDQPEPEDNEA
jgi:regulatory protein